ncbi:T5orf172 domain-containing protein [Archangium gephyra]|uniref:T5orf172 domain-containing protein n=1 Tax=Archangium gephyra TaxID=48 RepID=A0AAC8QH34_9BACT|nr:DUF4041 domain-containing protein [Archangium gephyra]AKJ06950.1 Hypothetical protein AA314_08576 [Archangium gephyra]REG31763.1 T5orf172 domain-containing protein [Archangium gephyra]
MLWVSLLLLAAALAALGVLYVKRRSTEDALRTERTERERLEKQVSELQAQNRALNKYQGIVDVEAQAAAIRSEAERQATEIVAQARRAADELIAEANQARQAAATEAEAMRARATDEAAAIKKRADAVLSNASTEAEAVRARATAEAAAIKQRADAVLANTSTQAEAVRAQATAEASQLKQRADALVANATAEAGRIIEAASKRAQEIAGEAFAAMQNTKQLEQTAAAMRNIIEGYGDRYVIPTQGVLDELAEHFGFTEAGARLKTAREQMREMIKSGKAATCDYVEANRRATAIEFVLDAFNGKVDSILTGVRHDNFGTLEQKVKDAFNVVNHNGKAFRDARITPEYLAVRMDELKWAVVAHELKLKEREEQRIIKERIREEEKAQREFERAQREAEKEEELLRKAMEKARREFEKAGDEQKSKYEEQLNELAAKLRAAEEKNQRALSMAQQTKTGHVYVISNLGSFGEDVFKVGLTRRLEPLDRIKELGDASVPFEFDVHALILSEDAPALERELHKRFVRSQVNKVNPRKEFFRVALQEIRKVVDEMGLQTQWTMSAEAREYRETQSIERSMQNKSFEESAWIKQQLKEHDVALNEAMHKEARAAGE